MASWDVIWGNIINALGGAGQAAPGAGAASGTAGVPGATPGAIPTAAAQSPSVLDAAQNANTMAVLAGRNAPSPAAQRAATQQGIVMSAQDPTLAQPQPQQIQPQTGLATPLPVATTVPVQATGVQGMGSSEVANLTPERGWWDTIMQNLSGRDSMGNPLTGEALTEFQRNHALGATLGQLGAALGGQDTWQGRLGSAAYNTAAGGLAAMNAEKQQMNQNDYMTAAASSMLGGQQQQKGQADQGPGGPIKQPTGVYTPQTAGGNTGATTTAPSSSSQVTSPTLDDTLGRMRRLNSGMF